MEGKPSHECGQGVTMSRICNKVENIENIIAEMKETQKEDMIEIRESQRKFMDKLEAMALNSAKYPSPEEVKDYIKKIDTHETRIADTGKMVWITITALVGMIVIFLREYITTR